MTASFRFFLLLSFSCLGACRPAAYFLDEADILEKKGEYLKAAAAYASYLKGSPRAESACGARVRLGRIYALRLRRCPEARLQFEEAARGFPRLEDCRRKAQAGIMSCPDYFPLENGLRWLYGDTLSHGKNMRLSVEAASSNPGVSARSRSKLYAGNSLIRSGSTDYEARKWEIRESRAGGKDARAVLRYPFHPGFSWTMSLPGRRLTDVIVSTSARAETAAGVFTKCLKVKEIDSRFPRSWSFRYYAPFVGKVKTTVGGPEFETPDTELLEFHGGMLQ